MDSHVQVSMLSKNAATEVIMARELAEVPSDALMLHRCTSSVNIFYSILHYSTVMYSLVAVCRVCTTITAMAVGKQAVRASVQQPARTSP
jgi:hypothetical protein